MKEFLTSLKMFLIFCVLCGIIYPLAATLAAETFFPFRAEGSIIKINGENKGSLLIAQKFSSAGYFWPRPSACNWQTMPSAANNLALFDAKTLNNIKMYEDEYKIARGAGGEMLFSSASGLDPHISPQSALAQAKRVAAARNIDIEDLNVLIGSCTEGRTWGFLGEERVNVLKLNLALDKYEK